MSFDTLIEKIESTQNPSVVGLDPKLAYLPQFLKDKYFNEYGNTMKAAAKAILEFNKSLIDAVCDIVPAIKPQCAYYEMYGYQGVKTLYKTIEYAKSKGLYVIVDGKRNDIGATMDAYTTAYLSSTDINGEQIAAFDGDSLTVNGYLGTDGISPLIRAINENNKGIFVLVKTSNPSSGELQDKMLEDGNTVYGAMGQMCEKWGSDCIGKYGYSSVGAVVGATYPEQLLEMRKSLPHTFFLVPGYGAQGGGAKGIANAFDCNGLGAIVNSSRAIMCAYQKEDCDEKNFAMAARREAIRMRNDIMAYVPTIKLI